MRRYVRDVGRAFIELPLGQRVAATHGVPRPRDEHGPVL